MAWQIDTLRDNFNQMNLEQKRQFIENLRPQAQSSKNPDYIRFLNECTAAYNAEAQTRPASSASASAPPPIPVPRPTPVPRLVPEGTSFTEGEPAERSYFDGGLLELILLRIGAFFITLFTLGICFPWAFCLVQAYWINHTVIEGRRLKFSGTGLSLLGNWIKWFLLTIITLGIYGFWVSIKFENWKVKHTTFA
jgi:hypothetical protein